MSANAKRLRLTKVLCSTGCPDLGQKVPQVTERKITSILSKDSLCAKNEKSTLLMHKISTWWWILPQVNFHFWEKFPFQHITSSLPEIMPKKQVGKGSLLRSSTIVSPWFCIILKIWRTSSILLQLKVTQVILPSQNQTWESSHHTDCSIEWKGGLLTGFPAAEVLLLKGKHPLKGLEFCHVSSFTYWLIIIIENFRHH